MEEVEQSSDDESGVSPPGSRSETHAGRMFEAATDEIAQFSELRLPLPPPLET